MRFQPGAFSAFERSSDKALAEQAFLQKKLGRCGAGGKLGYLICDEAQKIKNAKVKTRTSAYYY